MVSQTLDSTAALCESNAEWIVEDFEEDGELVPLANFGIVTFTNAFATTPNGNVGLDGATDIDIVQNGAIVTAVSISSQALTVQYL